MLLRLASLPYRVTRLVVRSVTGAGSDIPPAPRQADPWELRPPEPPERESDSDSHDHSHESDSGGTAPDPEAQTEEPKAATENSKNEVRPLTQVYPSDTPNPNAWKFTLDRKLVTSGSLSFNSKEEAQGNGLGRALFDLAGVCSVFAVNDFVTVTQDGTRDWGELSPQVVDAIQAHA